MCGIAGFFDPDSSRDVAGNLAAMCEVIAHRGPDAHGSWFSDGVAFGHQRLAILDLTTGAQPLSNEDGTIWITFNGEIYNFDSLRRELEGCGHKFRTASDTETIVHAYEEWGTNCLSRLRGMFAFVLYDRRRRTLLMARDRVGKKPLFYQVRNGRLVFASELQSLLQHPDVDRSVSADCIDMYLTYGYIAAPRSVFTHIKKLPPAHFIVLDTADLQHTDPVRYWSPEYSPKLDISISEAEEGLLERLSEATRIRMVADVPVGALLSGGIDSSLVVALMATQSSRQIQTFSIGFDHEEFNEAPYARMVAERFGTKHHELVVRADSAAILPTLVRHYGEPYADSSSIPSYYVSQITRQHVTVALNGDGGDESLGGYERYLGAMIAERFRAIPEPIRRVVSLTASSLISDRLPPRNRLRMARRFLDNAALPLAERYTRWMTFFTPEQKARLYTSAFAEQVNRSEAPERWLMNIITSGHGDVLDRLLKADLESYLPNDLLVKMDIATMANSLEARSPFLDQDVIEYAARLPSSMKIRGTSLKWLSRRLARKLVPVQAVDRRKMGFGAPVAAWLRGELKPLVHDVLLSRRSIQRGLFSEAELRRLVQRHEAGYDHSFQLWSLLWLELWHLEVAEGRPLTHR